jgi:orotidine-5'-phosphate decarboxylase
VKFNRHLILPLGLFSGVKKLLKKVTKYNLPAIMDCKINDIGNTNKLIAEYYYSAGFDAVTANPFVGWKGGLHPVFEVAEKYGKGVILLVYMSHPGSSEGYGQTVITEQKCKQIPQYRIFAEKAIEWGADGVVVGATFPDKIQDIYSILGREIPIYSPGVGTQGGNVRTTIIHGARYLIVGRTITMSTNPSRAAEQLKIKGQRALD